MQNVHEERKVACIMDAQKGQARSFKMCAV